MPPSSRCWAEIDLSAATFNFQALQQWIGEPARVVPVVKADAYGHGAVDLVGELRLKARLFGVADSAEAMELREAFPELPVLILGTALPEEREIIVREGFLPTVSSLDEAAAYADMARSLPQPSPFQIHVDIDTGMGRIGIAEDRSVETIKAIGAIPELAIAGISTHLPVADEDVEYTRAQIARFEKLAAALRESANPPPRIHALNSAGAIGFPKHAGDMVRIGLALYGASPIPDFQSRLRPVMTWKTRVSLVRELEPGRSVSYGRTFVTPRRMRVATLAVGYADGYRRDFSGTGVEVLVRGRRCALLGRVTMDQIMIDVSECPGVAVGDEVVLLGRQGQETISAAELAVKGQTIPWEIFTGISKRVVRIAHS